jgi:hypothetical protein
MHFDPRTGDHGLPFSPFGSCTAARPIGWNSTVDRDGNTNLAPCPRPNPCRER